MCALARPVAALLLALCFVFAAPLASILRYEIDQAWLLHDQPAATPQVAEIAFSSTAITFASFSAEIVVIPADPDCIHVFRDSSLPALLAPPIHDIMLVALPVLVGFVLLQRMCALPLIVLLTYGTSPPTPPPRYCTA